MVPVGVYMRHIYETRRQVIIIDYRGISLPRVPQTVGITLLFSNKEDALANHTDM